ncbi:amino acid ABC transporter substrate-binding protein [Acidaminobacter sp. JC074]|uniref:ABC transporter substrate-binding protein n=1 Tax=Acidaminobacter sp. JC074 TaxID=2530199 RepID=UPI001F0F2880|nr:ABC transporter substrate-binding protein [Acidaminobacter sp. JC074]MCH4890890.1 amino acid ABC transporter substrate-binding protein [Acidaminobacter sp. JC074]
MKKTIIIILLAVFLVACEKEPIKIGFIADISTKQSQLGVDARNSAELYIKNINENGGINGRMLELIIKDDGSDQDQAISMHNEFKDEGIQFVIGHLTSDMSDAVLKSQDESLLFLSPSMSTDGMSNLDDYFIRTSPISSRQGKIMSDYCHVKDIDDIIILYDVSNEEYTKNLMDYFISFYENGSYKVRETVAFNSKEDNLQDVVKAIVDLNPTTVFMISQANDTAFITQGIERTHDIDLLSVSWSMTQDLIQTGGSAVEDGIFIGIYVPETPSDLYNDFVDNYRDTFNYEPSFISAITYDIMVILEEGLKHADELSPQGLKSYIINREYTGLQETFSIDQYGDNDKRYLLYQLRDGEFTPMREWEN